MYFNGNEFLHYKFADDLLKKHDIVLDNNKLCIKLDGKYIEDLNMIKRKMLELENTLTMRNMNEVINRLRIIAKPINHKVKLPISTPVLLGEVHTSDTTKRIRVWCPYCKKYHHHGYDEKNTRKQFHKVAHCRTTTPFSEIGYIIKLKGEVNEKTN